MTDFVRIPGKIFAENASPVGNNPEIGKFGNAKQGIYTGEADVQEIQNSEAWSQGWTSAVVSAMNYPPLPEMNGVLKVLSYQICYLLQKGIPEWNADTTYYKKDYVNYNGKLYYSNIDNNTFEPETPGSGNSWLSGTSDVAIATTDTNGISRPDNKTLTINEDGILSVNGLNNPYTLFDSKYSEYPLYNASWLLSNGQYNSAIIYPTAYEALVIEQDTTKTAGTSYPLPSGENYIKRGLSVKLSTTTYSDYDFVLNIEEQTFRLPFKVSGSLVKTDQNTIPVVGNGIALGLTSDKSSGGYFTAGLYGYDMGGNNYLQARVASYGKPINGPDAGGSVGFSNNRIGVTVDPDKSGMVAQSSQLIASQLNLYFYVGEAVQNANLIEAGKVLEVVNDININKMDKNALSFYPADKQIIYGGTFTTKTEFDLSDILPDGLVYCFIQAEINTNANGNGSIRITSDLTPFEYTKEYPNHRSSLQTNNYFGTAGCSIIPTNNKKIYIQTQGVASNCWVYLYGYQTANLGV